MNPLFLTTLPEATAPYATATGTMSIIFIIIVMVSLLALALFSFIVVLLVKALLKYLKTGDVRKEKADTCRSLGEALKEHRIRCHLTQEFVAERLGVSRQAVSKWENGTADPSTTNLLALAKLYDISPEELLRQVQQ